jgi:hypothetical protein
MNAVLDRLDAVQERIDAWMVESRPALQRFQELDETQFSLPAVAPKATKVVPTSVLVADAVERYIALHGQAPHAVLLHPMRLLSLASYDENMFFCGPHIVVLRSKPGLAVDEVYGTCSVDTLQLEIVVSR